jgi:hypothetical protein
MRLPTARPLRTTFTTTLRFVPSGQEAPDRALAPPPSPPPEPPAVHGCLLVPSTPARVQRLATPAPLLLVSDHDAAQAERQRQRVCRRRGVRCSIRPRIVACAAQVRAGPGKERIVRGMRHQWGAFRRCYREALGRRPGLAGQVVLGATISPTGLLSDARVRRATVAEPALARCLTRALARITFRPSPYHISFTYPLRLVPALRPPVEVPTRATVDRLLELAAYQLRRGDGAAALVSYSALLRARPRAAVACHWRVNAVLAMVQVAPWIDARVRSAFNGLAAHLRQHPRGVYSGQCAARAARELAHLATDPHRRARRTGEPEGLQIAVAWYRRLLSLKPDPRQAHELSYYLAEALYRLERYQEALRAYEQVVRLGGRWVKDAADAARYCRQQLRVTRGHLPPGTRVVAVDG